MLSVAVGFATGQRLGGAVKRGLAAALLIFGCTALTATAARAQSAQPESCPSNGFLTPKTDLNISTVGAGPGQSQPNLKIDGTCTVTAVGDYFYGTVNIVKNGKLIFAEPTDSTKTDRVTNFWAKSIIIENGGTLQAGQPKSRYGKNLYTLNIILYGKDQSSVGLDPEKFPNGDPINVRGVGDPCIQTNCGVPATFWGKDISDKDWKPPTLDNGVQDYFYTYAPLYGTKVPDSGSPGYFGYKVLGVGYGGTLLLYGQKGTKGADAAGAADPTYSGTSWVRLNADLKGVQANPPKTTTLTVDRDVGTDWQPGDKIVVTTTDYLPSHSEELTIAPDKSAVNGKQITVLGAPRWDHVGHVFGLSRLAKAGAGFIAAFGGKEKLPATGETRAAVALLTRSIRIVSGGDFAGDYFDCASTDNGKTWYAPKELSHDQKPILVKPYQDPNDQNKEKPSCATARNRTYAFGGHATFRQGFQKLQVQGVEFHQLGQGGRMGYYPVHFHMARQVPAETYIKDSSVSGSMTRWFVLHSTQNVLLQRNVGWKSIGHGYYLEDGTEADNKFYANIGIFARAGVKDDPAVTDPRDKLNPRNIPGILASNDGNAQLRYRSDVAYPSVFWITNGWNEFVGNMAAGAGTCGICYWYIPAGNNDMVETNPMDSTHTISNHMKWPPNKYSGRQLNDDSATGAGTTPVQTFYKNYCTTAMHSLNTSNGISECLAVTVDGGDTSKINPVHSIAPLPETRTTKVGDVTKNFVEMYYPNLTTGNRVPTVCQDGSTNCNVADRLAVGNCDNTTTDRCGTTIIDHYTTSFHWAETNFSAVWLRTPGWFLMTDSFISDVQNGGLTFVSGGDYSRSSAPTGYWALVTRSVFAGETQPTNPFAYASGPRKNSKDDTTDRQPETGCAMSTGTDSNGHVLGLCIRKDLGIYFPLSNWATGQRLFNIYDGPAHQDANAYLDINVSGCGSAKATDDEKKKCMYLGTPGVRKFRTKWGKFDAGTGYLPNAAIGWKQPNGFYYPPAFHSKNLFFDNVDIRHYVIQPLYQPRTYYTDDARVQDEFVGINPGTTGLMTGFTDIDRQTELTDDDGSLTGFAATNGPEGTISVNEDGFFAAPLQAAQCKSNPGVTPDAACQTTVLSSTPPTARTSPYEYVTTVVYPGCAIVKDPENKPAAWETACNTTDKNTRTPYQDDKTNSRWAALGQRGGDWSRDCAGPYCFGVPIYRQYLTGTKGKDEETTAKGSNREWYTWFSKGCKKPSERKLDPYPDDQVTPKQIDVVKDDCDFPFARMSGASEWQRNIMTVNNGKYYIDTTRSKAQQRHSYNLGKPDDVNAAYVECDYKKVGGACEPRSVNEFQPGKTYYVFLMFAKPTTKQIYQIYVGTGFNPAKDLKGIKIVYVEGFFNWDDWVGAASSTNKNLPLYAEMLPSSPGVLQVTVDFSKVKNVSNDPKLSLDPKDPSNKGQVCHPLSFCTGDGSSCSCNMQNLKDARLSISPNLQKICDNTCKQWATKDLDAPSWGRTDRPSTWAGRLGFAFTLPSDGSFKADNSYHRPPPEPFPDKNSDGTDSAWKLVKFKNGAGAGDCSYTKIPGQTAQCGVPDCAPGMGPPPFCDKKITTSTQAR